MPSPAPGVKSARSGTLYNVRRFWDLEPIPGGAALYLSHFRLLTGAASQRARPVWTPKSALPGTGGAKDSVRTWDPRFPSAPLPPRGAGLQAGERPNFTSGAEAQIVTESRHEDTVDTGSGIECVGRGEGLVKEYSRCVLCLLLLDSCPAEEILDTSLATFFWIDGIVAEWLA